MSGKHNEPLSDAALEHIMRDVLYGLEDFSNMMEFDCQMADMEIVSITPSNWADTGEHHRSNVIRAPGRHTSKARALRLLQ